MKKKGQALVEFVIILPIFIMLVLGVIDIGNILYSKINLENTLSSVIELYQKDYSLSEIQSDLDLNSDIYEIHTESDGEYQKFTIIKKIDIITPGLNFVFDNPYELSLSRSIVL